MSTQHTLSLPGKCSGKRKSERCYARFAFSGWTSLLALAKRLPSFRPGNSVDNRTELILGAFFVLRGEGVGDRGLTFFHAPAQ
jgi:hypothetical protein